MPVKFRNDKIPLFPLQGALLLPKARLPLNIFEPRYLQMVKDSLKSENRLIGMIQPLDRSNEKVTTITEANLYKIGCAGKIVSFDELEDGRFMITLSGYSRFSLVNINEDASGYLQAEVDWSSYSVDNETEKVEWDKNFDYFLEIVSSYFSAKNISTNWETLRNADHENLVNSLSMLCPFENYEKQALLEAHSLTDRKNVLSTLMEMASQNQGNDIIQ